MKKLIESKPFYVRLYPNCEKVFYGITRKPTDSTLYMFSARINHVEGITRLQIKDKPRKVKLVEHPKGIPVVINMDSAGWNLVGKAELCQTFNTITGLKKERTLKMRLIAA